MLIYIWSLRSTRSTKLTVDIGSQQSVCAASGLQGFTMSPTVCPTHHSPAQLSPSYSHLSTASFCLSADDYQDTTLSTQYMEISPKPQGPRYENTWKSIYVNKVSRQGLILMSPMIPSVRLIRVLHQCPVHSLPRPRSVTSAGLSTRRWMMSRSASRSDSGEPPWEARPPPVTANGRVRCGTAGVRCPRATRRALERASSALLTARS